MVSAGAGGGASRHDQDDIPRMHVFRERIVQDDHREKGDPKSPVSAAKGIPIREAKIFPRLRRRLTPNEKIVEHEVLDLGVRDGVRRRTEGCAFEMESCTFRTRTPTLRRTAQRASARRKEVQQGSFISDQNWDVAVFEALAPWASLISASKMIGIIGCQKGWAIRQADAQQACTHSKLRGGARSTGIQS